MQTMYDRLGDLLSEALRTGEIPKSESDSSKVSFFYVPKDENAGQNNPEKKTSAKSGAKKSQDKVKSERLFTNANNATAQTGIRIPKEKIIPEEVKSALSFISIPENASFDEAKKIYREKLMYYHPDRRADNPVLQKIAKEKTERLLKEWECLEQWYESSKKMN